MLLHCQDCGRQLPPDGICPLGCGLSTSFVTQAERRAAWDRYVAALLQATVITAPMSVNYDEDNRLVSPEEGRRLTAQDIRRDADAMLEERDRRWKEHG